MVMTSLLRRFVTPGNVSQLQSLRSSFNLSSKLISCLELESANFSFPTNGFHPLSYLTILFISNSDSFLFTFFSPKNMKQCVRHNLIFNEHRKCCIQNHIHLSQSETDLLNDLAFESEQAGFY